MCSVYVLYTNGLCTLVFDALNCNQLSYGHVHQIYICLCKQRQGDSMTVTVYTALCNILKNTSGAHYYVTQP